MVDYSDTQLGQETRYSDEYDPLLLCPIPRAKARQQTEQGALAFMGTDIWTAFEISWLNPDGLPQVAIGEFFFPCTSESIIESKSFKLYLNSVIQTRYESMQVLHNVLVKDLSAASGSHIEIVLYELSEYAGFNPILEPDGICVDQQSVVIDTYQPDAFLLTADRDEVMTETLYSHLLKTNCPVTDQPDWASVYITYHGPKICREGLLKYIVSYRMHQDFHEQCVEQIFNDLMAFCQPSELSVYARYMRRGGLDINPYRSTTFERPQSIRQVRQ